MTPEKDLIKLVRQEYMYDPSPPGVGLSPGFMVDIDPCPECNPDGDKEEEK